MHLLPLRNRCVFSCKMRPGFILIEIYLPRMTHPRRLVCFSMKNARSTNPPASSSFFESKMRLAFLVTMNSYDPRVTAPGFPVFFQLKHASRELFQIPCVFSSKTRLCKFIWLAADSSHIPCLFHRKRSQESSGYFVFSQVQCVLGSQLSINSHVMLPVPAGRRLFFQGKTRLTGIAGKFQS